MGVEATCGNWYMVPHYKETPAFGECTRSAKGRAPQFENRWLAQYRARCLLRSTTKDESRSAGSGPPNQDTTALGTSQLLC
ncbi:hypothetical protein TNCV_3258471 [Trichonephila clavipes]|nr:hypothetical protein TNCV_3258471 [Trichonephila clavipes]